MKDYILQELTMRSDIFTTKDYGFKRVPIFNSEQDFIPNQKPTTGCFLDIEYMPIDEAGILAADKFSEKFDSFSFETYEEFKTQHDLVFGDTSP